MHALLRLIVLLPNALGASAVAAHSSTDGKEGTALRPELAQEILSESSGDPRTLQSGASATSTRQRITAVDLARFATIGNPNTLRYNAAPGDAAVFSPNREYVAVVVRRGNPAHETNDAILLVYRASDLLGGGRGTLVATFSSAANYQPIASVQWLADGHTIVFAGTEGGQPSQIYSVNIRTRQQQELTREQTQLLWYDVTPTGSHIVTTSAGTSQPPSADEICLNRGCLVTSSQLVDVEQGTTWSSPPLTVYDVGTKTVRRLDSPETLDDRIEGCEYPYPSTMPLPGGVSPNGRFVLRSCRLREWPAWWGDYTGYAKPRSERCLKRGMSNSACDRALVVVDLERGTSKWLNDVPFTRDHPEPIWIDNGRQLILPGAFETLMHADAQERAKRARAWAVLLVDPATRQTVRIARLSPDTARVSRASWDDRSDVLTIECENAAGNALPPHYYRRVDNRWKEAGAATITDRRASEANVNLVVEQSMNQPPSLIAVDRSTDIRQLVLDPNRWLSQREIGRVEMISWSIGAGITWKGGLYYPPGHMPGRKYPVVLQTHGFTPEKFALQGAANNFAAQAIAARDILVLQIDEAAEKIVNTPKEWHVAQAGYESAIDYLDKLGLIDRNRVGIIGWSRTGPYAGYTLTHSSYPFAAGAFTSTADIGWWYYLAAGSIFPDLDTTYGSAPFGVGLGGWLESAPSFNLDRIRTPMFLWRAGWDWYAALRRLGKPVEYWNSPDGPHDAYMVGERINLNELLVDWFDFWLNEREDLTTSKKDQYTRWRILRQQRNAMLMEQRPPLLQWSAVPLEPTGSPL